MLVFRPNAAGHRANEANVNFLDNNAVEFRRMKESRWTRTLSAESHAIVFQLICLNVRAMSMCIYISKCISVESLLSHSDCEPYDNISITWSMHVYTPLNSVLCCNKHLIRSTYVCYFHCPFARTHAYQSYCTKNKINLERNCGTTFSLNRHSIDKIIKKHVQIQWPYMFRPLHGVRYFIVYQFIEF